MDPSHPSAGDDESSDISVPARKLTPVDIWPPPPAAGAHYEPDRAYEASVDTAFGGLFFLINLGIALDLYGDFTMPTKPGIALSPWDFLALLGRRLVGEEIEADPIWPLLALLAGRKPEEGPSAGFLPPDEWRLPSDWRDPFDTEGAWSWSADDHHLVVEHPAGFTVLDIGIAHLRGTGHSRSRQVRRLLRREMALYQNAVRPRPGSPSPHAGAASPLERWLDWLEPYVQARLAEALRIDRAGVADLLVRYQARVFISTVNVDVVLSLADLPIAIRLCGLDRDPGWLPAANRVVTFHFV